MAYLLIEWCRGEGNCNNIALEQFSDSKKFQPFVHRSPWSPPPATRCSRPRAVTSVINRYYDPSTDQFLSVDPDVQQTDQPYVFTNDDPLNAEDPLGQKIAGVNETNAETKAVATIEAEAAAKADEAAEAQALAKAQKKIAFDENQFTQASNDLANAESDPFCTASCVQGFQGVKVAVAASIEGTLASVGTYVSNLAYSAYGYY